MAGVEYVDGWISDESSFYGDDETKAELEEQCKRALKLPYHFPVARISPKKRKRSPKPSSADKRAREPAMHSENVLDFLKSRPQISVLESSATDDPRSFSIGPPVTKIEGADLLEVDRFNGDPAAWQHNETINAFLKRAPVSDPNTAQFGPWLWVNNPKISRALKKQFEKQDVDAFTKAGGELLHAFKKRRLAVEAENFDRAQATVTRKMGPYRDQLQDDLLSAAVKTVTCGKWMLFPTSEDLPRYWRLVAEATSECKLGPTAKVATYDPYDTKGVTLICIYTYNFADLDDVRRVLDELLELGLCSQDGRPIYYKCDAYTYLGIESNNSYKLRASLFSSKEVFGNEARALADGPIARLKKRNKTIDSFLSS